MIPAAIGSFVLLMVVVYLIGRPFVAPLRYAAGSSLEQLLADRERLRAQLRELDMDFETGKLAQEEYDKLRARRRQQIEATTRAIHDAETSDEELPSVGVGTPDATPEDLGRELERRISERKAVLEELEAHACPGCGTTTDPEDRFCRKCGADLATVETR
ncbi:MAG TPA: zinc ribbon domain-containing protein [Actinomycetota bacterium]|nr:zinc ribbon domain-containing protein [Actinomycetota bacterium]